MQVYSLTLLASTIIAFVIAILTWRRRSAPGAYPLFFMLCTTVLWAGANSFLLQANSPEARQFWFNVLIVGGLTGTPALLAFSLQYTGRGAWLTRRNILLICLIPFISVLLGWTNNWHHWFYQTVDFSTPTPSGAWQVVPGTGYQIFLAYSYPTVLFSTAIIIQAFFRLPRLYRGQAGMILTGTLIPFIGNIIYNGFTGGATQGAIDPTPILFTLMGIFYAYGLFAFRLFDLVPIVRHTLVEKMTDGMIVLDMQNRIVDVNQPVARMVGSSPDKLLGMKIEVFIPLAEELSEHSPAREIRTEMEIGEAERRYYDILISPLFEGPTSLIGRLVVFRDITERKRIQDELQKLATTDPLTNLFNRRHFFETGEKEFAKALRYDRPLALILFDIDLFKTINDTYGHLAGDQVLTRIGTLLHENERETDLTARYGGEEFIILLPETNCADAKLVAERLRKLMEEESIQIAKHLIRFTASFGVAAKDNLNSATFDSLVSQADQALYEAKRMGRNQVVCSCK